MFKEYGPLKNKHVLKLERIQRISTNMVPELKDLPYEEILKDVHLTTLKERRERRDLITMYKLMNNLEETDRKDIILRIVIVMWRRKCARQQRPYGTMILRRKKGEATNLRDHKKKWQKRICLNDKKKNFPKEVYILEMD